MLSGLLRKLEVGVRWKWGLLLMASSILLWLGSMIADPYTAWGIEHEQVRPSVARLSEQLAIAVLVFILAASLTVYWNRDSWRNLKGIAFAAALSFVGGTAIVRLVWIQFYVLV